MSEADQLYRNLRGRESLLRLLLGFRADQPGQLRTQLTDWISRYSEDSDGRSGASAELWWRQPYPRSRLGGLGAILTPLVDLAAWADGVLRAEDGASRFLDASKAKADLARVTRPDDPPLFRERLNTYLDLVSEVEKPSDLTGVVLAAAALPLTVAVEGIYKGRTRGDRAGPAETPTHGSDLVVRVRISIDRQLWTDVQLIRAGELHDIFAAVAVPEWPNGAHALRLSYVTAYPPEFLHIDELVFSPQPRSRVRDMQSTGTARFEAPHASNAAPSQLRVRAAFQLRSGEFVDVPVVGTYELPFRVSDSALADVPKTYGVLDARVAEALKRVDEEIPGVPPDHRADFVEAFQGVLAYQSHAYLSASFKRTTQLPESEFQKSVVQFLRAKHGR